MKKVLPKDIFKKIANTGLLRFAMGKWIPKYFPTAEFAGIKIEKPDFFHEMALIEEVVKYGSVGLAWGIGTASIGLPPLINHGSEYL